MAAPSQYSIEVRICGVMLVLPFNHLSTVEEVSQAAYEEYQRLNPRAPPIKMLCVRDANSRILSGKLNIIKHQLEHFLNVQTEDWTEADLVTTPQSLDAEYRKWQYWTARQVYEMLADTLRIENLGLPSSSSDPRARVQSGGAEAAPGPGPGGDATADASSLWIGLLDELCASPDDKVQNMCVKSLHALRQRSRDEQHVRYASAQLVRMLQASPHFHVAEGIMAVYQTNAAGLLPLSQYHAEELLMLATSVSLDDMLVRFPQQHASIVKAFNKMYSSSYAPAPAPAPAPGQGQGQGLVGALDGAEAINDAANALSEGLDEEKREEVQSVRNTLVVASAPPPLAQRVSESTSSAIRSAFETRLDRGDGPPLHSPVRGSHGGGGHSISSSGLGGGSDRAQGSMSLSRLLSLLQSEEPSMRVFALDKLHAALQQLSTPPPTAAPTIPVPLAERFAKSGEDVESLAVALFQLLQESLARPSRQTLDPSAPGSPKKLFPRIFDAPAGGSFVVPTATRLVQAAMESPDTDISTVRLVMSCLIMATTSQGAQFRQLPVRGYRLANAPAQLAPVVAAAPSVSATTAPAAHASARHGAGKAASGKAGAHSASAPSPTPDSTPTPALSPPQDESNHWLPIVARAGRRWARLLITLSHLYDESLAEPFAFLATKVIAAAGGWDAAGARLDYSSMALFLAIKPTHELVVEPEGWGEMYGKNYRLGLALDWAAVEAARPQKLMPAEDPLFDGGGAALGGRRSGVGEASRSMDRDVPSQGSGLLVPPLPLGSQEAPWPGQPQQPLGNGRPRRPARRGDEVPRSFAGALQRENWDMLMRLWSIASSTSPPSRAHRLLAMQTLASVSNLADVQTVLDKISVLAK